VLRVPVSPHLVGRLGKKMAAAEGLFVNSLCWAVAFSWVYMYSRSLAGLKIAGVFLRVSTNKEEEAAGHH